MFQLIRFVFVFSILARERCQSCSVFVLLVELILVELPFDLPRLRNCVNFFAFSFLVSFCRFLFEFYTLSSSLKFGILKNMLEG